MRTAKREDSSTARSAASVCPYSGASPHASLQASPQATEALQSAAAARVSCFQLVRIVYHWIQARGNFSEAIRRTMAALRRRSFSIQIGKYKALFTTEPELIHHVMVSEPSRFPKTQWEQRILKPVMDGGLIILEDERWQHDRRILAGCFGKEFLSKLPDIVRASCHSRMTRWQRGVIDVSHEMRCIVNDVIRRYFLGQAPSDSDELAQLYERAENELEVRVFDPFQIRERYRAWKDPNWKLNAVVEKISQAIAEPVLAEQNAPSQTSHPLRHLVGKLSSAQAVVEEVRTLAAASLTTGHLLSWLSYLLARHPDVQMRLRDEIRRGTGHPSLADFENMKYLSGIVNEGLRLYPPAPFLLRTARGSQETDLVFIPIWAMHRDPDFWPESTRFAPERWLGPSDTDHEMFIPFGLGSRVCIGKRFAMIEARVILYELARQFWFEPMPGYDTQPKIGIKMDILTRPRKNMRVLITPASL